MPPVRIKERARAKKGTMKRLLKQLFKLYPFQLITSAICIVFNILANLSSSVFTKLITNVTLQAITPSAPTYGTNPFVDMYDVALFGNLSVYTNNYIT